MLPTPATAAARPLPAPPPATDEAARWSELRTLNEGLRALASVDLAARAWVEGWIAFVCGAFALSLVLDPIKTPAHTMWATAFGAFAGLLFVDIVRLRIGYVRLAREEETRLARQRELRRELNVDEAFFPDESDE